MGVVTTAHGCILCYVGGASSESFGPRTSQNAEALRALPAEDAYPALTRNMVSIPAMAYPGPGLYKVQVIHFGLSLKDAHEVWDIWTRKFERLLAAMTWDTAEVHLDVEWSREPRRFDFRWTARPVGAPDDDPPWARVGEMPPSESRSRFEAFVPEAERELAERPDDTDLMQRLVSAYDRLGHDAKARELFATLEALDPERARHVVWI